MKNEQSLQGFELKLPSSFHITITFAQYVPQNRKKIKIKKIGWIDLFTKRKFC